MDFGPLAAGFPSIPGFSASKEDITEKMYRAVLDALEKKPRKRPKTEPIRLQTPSFRMVLGLRSTSDTLARLRGGHPASARVVHEVVKVGAKQFRHGFR